MQLPARRAKLSRLDNPEYVNDLNSSLGPRAIGDKWGISRHAAGRDRKKLRELTSHLPAETPLQPDVAAQVDVGPEGGTFTNVKSDQPITDWTHVFEKFGLDPEEFTIVNDTVRMSVWQQSKRLENGERDIINLYSYKARFRRRMEIDTLDLPALYTSVQAAPAPPESVGTDRATVVVWADPQIGKTGSRGGTRDLIERSNEKRAALRDLLEHRQPERCVLLDAGDGIEGFESGGNPMFTNDLSLAKQLDLYGTELFEWTKTLLAQAPVTIAAVPSNHAAWRNGKQNLGNPGDDLGLFMHRQVQKMTDIAGLPVDWKLPHEHDESVSVDVYDTRIGLVHGNQFGPGQAITWWEKQAFGNQPVATADVMVTGHYHTFGAGVAGTQNGRQRWWLGAPTLDNGSDWYRNTTGRDNHPGVLVFDITSTGFDLGSVTIL